MNLVGRPFTHLNTMRPSLFRYAATRFNFSTEVDPSSIRVNQFHYGLHMNPHPAKVKKGGEDAASVTDNLIALADGVGGWSQ